MSYIDYKNDNAVFIRDLKKGNERSYQFLLKEYHQKLFVYAFSLSNDYARSKDIVQNTFLKIWELRETLDAERSLQHFLYKIVYHEFINQFKKQKAIKAVEQTYFHNVRSFFENNESIDLDNKMTLVWKEVQNLPPKCKQIFLLSKKEGLTNMEIADYLQLSKRTVETQISKAFSVIRKNIKKNINHILFFLFGKNDYKKLS